MKKYFIIAFCLPVCLLFIPHLYAALGSPLEGEYPSRFQYRQVQGLDWHWQDWKIHFGGQLAVDAVAYDRDNEKRSGIRWETVSFRIAGSYGGRGHFYLEPDLLGVDTKNNLYEAWMGCDLTPAWHVRAGQIKVAFNTEFATRPEHFPGLDYAFSSYLDNRYDIGLQVDGLFWGRAAWFQGSATVGAGFDLDGKRRSDPLLSLRTVVFPLQFTDRRLLQGGFVSLGIAWSPDYDDDIFMQTPMRSTVFKTPDLRGDSFRSLHLEVGWYSGPFRFCAERVKAGVYGVKSGSAGKQDFDQLTSWSACASWCITGERVRWGQGAWLPPLIKSGGDHTFLNLPGCLEVACRYSNADLDRGLFDHGLAAYGSSTQEVRTATLNLNWYPRPGLKISAGWVKTIADHELFTLGGTNRDSSFVVRTNLVL